MHRSYSLCFFSVLGLVACGASPDGEVDTGSAESSATGTKLDSFGRSLVGSYAYAAFDGSFEELDALTLAADGTYQADKPATKSSKGAPVHETGRFTASASARSLTLKPSSGSSRRYTVEAGDDHASLQLTRGGHVEAMIASESPPPTTPGGPTVPTACAGRKGGAFVQLTIAGESLTVWSTDGAFIDEAKQLAASGDKRTPVFDVVIDGTDCDAAYSWHVDPAKMSFADFTTEVCDGTPSYLESHKATWMKQVGRYCPWGPTVKAVDDRR